MVIAAKEQLDEVMARMFELAHIAIETGRTQSMAALTGVARTTLYDWANAYRAFGQEEDWFDSSIPMSLYVAAARLSGGRPALAEMILEFALKHDLSPTQLLAIDGVPLAISGHARAQYNQGSITLHVDQDPVRRPENVRYRLVGLDPEEYEESPEMSDVRRELLKMIAQYGRDDDKDGNPSSGTTGP